jgi:hypothetical protein
MNFIAIVPLIPVLVFSFWLRSYYLKTSNEIKRIESLGKMIILKHLRKTLISS